MRAFTLSSANKPTQVPGSLPAYQQPRTLPRAISEKPLLHTPAHRSTVACSAKPRSPSTPRVASQHGLTGLVSSRTTQPSITSSYPWSSGGQTSGSSLVDQTQSFCATLKAASVCLPNRSPPTPLGPTPASSFIASAVRRQVASQCAAPSLRDSRASYPCRHPCPRWPRACVFRALSF